MATHTPDRHSRIIFTSTLALALGACGDSAPTPAADADAAEPDTPSSATDATAEGDGDAAEVVPWEPPAALTWTPCGTEGSRAECADLGVPLDRSTMDGAVTLHLLRVPALEPALRIGVLLVNPGGPGAPGSGFAQSLGSESRYRDIARRFDIVGVDWRGVGESLPTLTCIDPAELDAVRAVPATEATMVDAWYAAAVSTCREAIDPAFLARVGAADAAQDMEWVRRALGEDQLNFLGVSYGTKLGATYASMFPDRVRAFVLDAAVTPEVDVGELLIGQAAGYEAALGRFFAWCGASTGCSFHGGEGADAVTAAYDALFADLDAGLALGAAGGREAYGGDVGTAVSAFLSAGAWSGVHQVLAHAADGDGQLALDIADAVLGRDADGGYAGFVEANLFILCADWFGAGAPDRDALVASMQEAERVAPRHGTDQGLLACLGWPHPAPVVAIDAADAPPMMVVAGLKDPATPADWGYAMRLALGNGSYLVESNHEGHGAINLSGYPVFDRMRDFLIDPSREPDRFSCIATLPPWTTSPVEAVEFRSTPGFDPPPAAPITVTLDLVSAADDTVLATVSGPSGTELRVSVPTSGLPLEAYTRISAEGYRTREHWFAKPHRTAAVTDSPQLIGTAKFAQGWASLDVDAALGVIVASAKDCDSMVPDGAAFALSPDAGFGLHAIMKGDPADCAYDTHADQSDACGYAIFLEVPAGTYRPSYEVDGVTISGREVRVHAATTTTIDVRP